jgi:hypothetical protein
MQKVVGSSPILRSEKRCKSGWAVVGLGNDAAAWLHSCSNRGGLGRGLDDPTHAYSRWRSSQFGGRFLQIG